MSDESAPSRVPGERDPAGRNGVRTYRGRTVEELIPRIRAELGPDAIILREREGLTGGIGGFFAQRCVEIDAQAAPRLSVYDDDFDEDDEGYEEYDEADDAEEPEIDGLHSVAPPEPAAPPLPQASPAPAIPPLPQASPAPRPQAPPPPTNGTPPRDQEPAPAPPPPSAPSRPASPFLDEASFAARLEEATFAVDEAPGAEPRYRPAASAAPPLFIAFDELGEERETPPAHTPPPAMQPVIDLADIEHSEPEPARSAEPEPAPQPESAAEPAPTPDAAADPRPHPEPESAPQSRVQPPPADLAPDPKAPWMAFAAEAQLPMSPSLRRPPAPPAATAAPPPFAPTPAPSPAAPPEPAPPQPPPVPQAQAPQSQPPQAQPAPPSVPVQPSAPGSSAWPSPAGAPNPAWPAGPGYGGPRRRGGLLPAAERMLRAALEATAAANERRNMDLQARAFPGAPPIPGQPQPPTQAQVQPPMQSPGSAPPPAPSPPAQSTPQAPPPAQPNPAADAEAQRREEQHRREAMLERQLIRSGISAHRAAALVAGAISRRGPFTADGQLADEVRSALIAALPMPHTLPKDSAIAIVGAGGSGKTRCVAALAAAYSGAGVAVSVASFGGPTREDELGELLHGENVNVIPAMRTRATARAVSSAREHSLVIIDTASASPGDDSTIDMIAEALHSFRLDAIYLAVPATLSLPAALKLVDSFSAFALAGMVATHVDETDQLGMIAELSMQTGIPVVYTHTGLDLQTAIASADAEAIATSLVWTR